MQQLSMQILFFFPPQTGFKRPEVSAGQADADLMCPTVEGVTFDVTHN
jgi:hypothetical protein